MKIFLVFGHHNRHGQWLAAVYDNEIAAQAHKKQLDETQNGWDNFCGGEIQEIETHSQFIKFIKSLY